jgi:hypothetical protein
MFQRVPQPPVDPARRNPERHSFWPGFIVAMAGLLLVLAGAQRSTGVSTVEGDRAGETEFMKAFTAGGIQYADQLTPPEPPKPTGNPAADAAAFARWDKQMASAEPVTWKIRVDTSAKDPCPT